jgi:hypothetical protein
MKVFIILILSCASILGADTDLHVVTTTKTNASGSVSTKDIFTRGGQTNLVRNTSAKDGVVQIRVHRFYHDDSLVGFMTTLPDSSSTTSEAGSSYSLDFEYGPSNQLKYVVLAGKDGGLADAFSCTNGLLLPVESYKLRNAAEIGTDAKELISNAQKNSPDEFNGKVERLIEKYNAK